MPGYFSGLLSYRSINCINCAHAAHDLLCVSFLVISFIVLLHLLSLLVRLKYISCPGGTIKFYYVLFAFKKIVQTHRDGNTAFHQLFNCVFTLQTLWVVKQRGCIIKFNEQCKATFGVEYRLTSLYSSRLTPIW